MKFKIKFFIVLFLYSWILNFFYAADKDHSNSLSKKECRALLKDSFNVEMPDHLFEKFFKVKFLFCFYLFDFYIFRMQIHLVKVH
jgi:hypothetical protein